jgi:hypothetical protein
MSELKTRPEPETPPLSPADAARRARLEEIALMDHDARVDALRGFFAGMSGGTEELFREKRLEIEREIAANLHP